MLEKSMKLKKIHEKYGKEKFAILEKNEKRKFDEKIRNSRKTFFEIFDEKIMEEKNSHLRKKYLEKTRYARLLEPLKISLRYFFLKNKLGKKSSNA